MANERDPRVISPPASIELFGHRPTLARVRLIPRSPVWRAGHALLALGICWGAILVVMWVPPHIPWILTAFALGILFAVKYARERYTLVELEGTCPRCGAPQTITRPTRFGDPHRLHCAHCHQLLLVRAEAPAAERMSA